MKRTRRGVEFEGWAEEAHTVVGAVLGLEAVAELCIFGVRSLRMRVRGSIQKNPALSPGGWRLSAQWLSSDKLGFSTTLGVSLSALCRLESPSPLVQNVKGEWGTGI